MPREPRRSAWAQHRWAGPSPPRRLVTMIAVAASADAPGREGTRRDAGEREVDVALRGGSTLHVRPVAAGDGAAMRAFFEALSPESIGLRFFGVPNVDWVTKWAVDVDGGDRYALVATTGPKQLVVAHGAYVRGGGGGERAEVAFVVADAWQGQGIATIMLGQLAAAAHAEGVTVFTAEVLPHNHRMIDVFRNSGFPIELRGRGDSIEVRFPTSLSEEALVQFEQREATAAAAAVRTLLHPASVAVIGDCATAGSLAAEVLRNLLADGFAGQVYPVDAAARSVAGLPSFASVTDVRARVDLAVLALEASACVTAARACGAAGVRTLVVLSGGFADAGEDGAALQRELLAACRESGMRLVGPACLGVLNPAAPTRLHATYAGAMPQFGGLGVLSQSAGLGAAILELAGARGIGVSSFVSVGDKADISGNDLLQYWEQDAYTAVAALYLESFGNPRRFARIARRVARSKPVVVVKGGRTAAGARAASSHAGALLASSEITVEALFEQAGVIRADTIGELFDVAALLCAQPPPAGSRVAIVSNAGGPAVLAADASDAGGLEVVELAPRVKRALRAALPAAGSVENPIDLRARGRAGDYRLAIEALAQAGASDAILTVFVPAPGASAAEVAGEVAAAAAAAPGLTFASVYMGGDLAADPVAEGMRSVPRFAFPEDAARALAHAGRYGSWRVRAPGALVAFADTRPDEAAAIIVGGLAGGGGWLPAQAVASLLDCYGLPLLPSRVVRGAEAAVAAAAELDAPVALKALAAGLVRKGEAGAVALDLGSGAEVRRAASELRAAVSAAGHRLAGFLVQPMAPAGVELTVGVAHDANFGPVIVCGLAGAAAEVLRDAAARITPLTDVDARELLRGLRSFPLLTGFGASAPCDIAAIEEVLLRLSALVETHPEVAEIDLSPLLASEHAAVIVDARVRLEPPPPSRPLSALRG